MSAVAFEWARLESGRVNLEVLAMLFVFDLQLVET
jgi:hypothetical protein